MNPINIDAIKKRLNTWWERGETDRPLFVMRTETDIPKHKEFFADSRERWLNIEKRLEFEELKMSRTIYHAEAFPAVSADLGPGSLALLLKAIPGFDWDTVWYHPCFSEPESTVISLDNDAEYWKWTLEFTKAAIKRANGKYRVELPDLIENYDTLCSLLGAENLFYAMIDSPDEIHRMQEETLAAWIQAYDTLYSLIKDSDGGMSVGGFNLWAPGRLAKLQCDISIALSDKMFDTFAAPYFVKQAQHLDYVLYHFDGPNALQHTDTLLSIKEIDAVQWQPGSAYPSAIDPMWYDLQQRILDSGRSIMIFEKPGDPDTLLNRLEAFIKTVGKKGVLIVIEQNVSQKLAYDILNASYKFS